MDYVIIMKHMVCVYLVNLYNSHTNTSRPIFIMFISSITKNKSPLAQGKALLKSLSSQLVVYRSLAKGHKSGDLMVLTPFIEYTHVVYVSCFSRSSGAPFCHLALHTRTPSYLVMRLPTFNVASG